VCGRFWQEAVLAMGEHILLLSQLKLRFILLAMEMDIQEVYQ
jgi:hypothetical protein